MKEPYRYLGAGNSSRESHEHKGSEEKMCLVYWRNIKAIRRLVKDPERESWQRMEPWAKWR